MRVEGQRDDDGHLGGDLLRGPHCGLDLGQIAHRLDEDEIGAALDQAAHLLGEVVLGEIRSQGPHRLEELAGGPEVPGDQSAVLGGRFLGQSRAGQVEGLDLVAEVLQLQPGTGATEGVGGDDLRTGVEVGAVDGLDVVRSIEVPRLRRLTGIEARGLEHRAHRSVEDDVGGLGQQGVQRAHAHILGINARAARNPGGLGPVAMPGGVRRVA